MSASKATVTAKFAALSPAAKVVIAAGGLLVGALFVHDYVWSYATEWNAQADRLESLLERGANRQSALSKDIERAVIAYGKAEVPTEEASTSQSLAKAITETLRNHHIANSGYESLQGGKLPTNAFAAIVGAGQRIERVRGQVSFETDADEVSAILADLELHPAIDSIYSVRLNRVGDTRKVSVKLLAEAWATSAKAARKGAAQ
ncbi:MAG: hypothetical protein EXS03_03020 [Phycisphaerales bacterium]|nr:hypothetical protein [Phycisphaerales bacterium]